MIPKSVCVFTAVGEWEHFPTYFAEISFTCIVKAGSFQGLMLTFCYLTRRGGGEKAGSTSLNCRLWKGKEKRISK